MTKEEIIELAKEAGMAVTPPSWGYSELYHFGGYEDKIQRFAALVEQHTHTNNKARWYQEGVEAERNNPDPLHLSRILHELAGAASMCWNPRPTGVFDSQEAIGHVVAAIQEIRSRMDT
jgi:hypothetical protein